MNILQIYSNYSISYRNEGIGWINTSCPYCSDSGQHLGYNLQGNYFNCFRCGHKKLLPTLQRLTGLDKNSVLKLLQSLRTARKPKVEEVRVRRKRLKMPSNVKDLIDGRSHRYLLERGFFPDGIRWDWYVQSIGPISMLDDINYKFRLFIPIYHENKMVSFQTRDITGRAKLKYLACPKDREIIHHKHLLYGLDKAKIKNYCIVVEGVFDVWKLGPPAVATFGIQYTNQQVDLLCQNFDTVFILFDSEKQAQKQAKKLQGELELMGVNAKRITLTSGDPAEMSNQEMEQLKTYIRRIVR